MTNKTQKYTIEHILGKPTSQEAILKTLRQFPHSFHIFQNFRTEHQERLMAFLMGKRGLKITYDNIFHAILSPEQHPRRLESLISSILGQPVHILRILPREGTTLSDSGHFVIMDIVVMTMEKTIINVEIQKIGYLFPGQRTSCYAADLIMRQYNSVKSEKKEKFSYKDMKPVIVIILMENSSEEFLAVSPRYIHRQADIFDSGAQVEFLQKIIYISLDTFHKFSQNISTELDAWLTFLSCDDPDQIVRLVNAYPEFLPCYQEIVNLRNNPKELIYMFSEALAIMDRNTEEYMIEQWKREMEAQKAAMEAQKTEIEKQKLELLEKEAQIAALQAQLKKISEN